MRLREETEYKPKPMVFVGNKPILWHIMKIYMSHGFNDFIICLGYKGEQIKNYFLNYEWFNNDITLDIGAPTKKVKILKKNNNEQFKVTLVNTGDYNMTGSRIKQVEPYIKGDDFFVTYGDSLGNVDITELYRFHKSHDKLATVTGVIPKSRFGIMEVDESRVINFIEKPKLQTDYINGGFFVFKKGFFNYLSDDETLVLEKEPLQKLLKNKELMVYSHNDFWHCMDNIRDRDNLNDIWKSNKVPWKTWEE